MDDYYKLDNEGKYKVYRESAAYHMPLLKREGRVPLSVAQIMQAKLEHGEEFPAWDAGYTSGDALVCYAEKIKIVLDSTILRDLNQEYKRERMEANGLNLSEEEYKKLEGKEFLRKDLVEYASWNPEEVYDGMPEKIKNNPLWQTLARDQDLLNDYVNFAFRKKNGIEDKVHLDGPWDIPVLKPWHITSLKTICNGRLIPSGLKGYIGFMDSQFTMIGAKQDNESLEEKV